MKLRLAAWSVVTVMGLAGCDAGADVEVVAEPVETSVASEASPAIASATLAPITRSATPAAPGAPSFAVLYPGGTIDERVLGQGGPTGDGGLVTFVTDASPEAVIAFYETRAKAADLAPVMAMTQGETRAYGAAEPGPEGASLSVVASPGDDGTSVQLSWSEGQ